MFIVFYLQWAKMPVTIFVVEFPLVYHSFINKLNKLKMCIINKENAVISNRTFKNRYLLRRNN